tara:strand:+ start:6456 stop:6656 length:201 start_codon:yes stop_codon:yes gene_type:complete
MEEQKRLYRSRTDRKIAGIAAGMAEYFNMDPTMMRIIWVLLAIITSGGAALLYILLIFIVPEGPLA